MSQPWIKPQWAGEAGDGVWVPRPTGDRAPRSRGVMRLCFRKMGLAVVSSRWEVGRLKGKRRSSPQRECCQQEWGKGRFSLWRRGIKVTKQIRVTRNVMESLRKLDEFGRCLFFILFYFLNKSVMHSFHTYECKGTVNVSGRHTNSHLLSLQTSFFHLTFKTLCNPTPVFSSSFCISVHPLQPNFTIHPWNHPQTSWPVSRVFTICFHVRCHVHLHSSSLQ